MKITKKSMLAVAKAVVYPLVWCWRTVQDAPVICLEDNLIGFHEFVRYTAPEHRGVCKVEKQAACGSVRHACVKM